MLLLSGSGAFAQPELDAGRFQQRFEIEKPPEVNGKALVPAEQAPALSEQSVGPEFLLKGIRVEGATAFASEELEALYASRVGQEVTLGDVKAIANAVTTYYRNAGYILSRAVVPPQRVEDGIVTIRVTEGYVDEVLFEGAEEQNNDLLFAYARHITAERPISNTTLERYLLLLNDLTGVEARGVLVPSESHVGASVLRVELKYDPFDGNVFINNRGSRFLGPLQMGATAGMNSLLGLSEHVQLRSVVSGNLEELRYYEAGYQQPVGGLGTSLRALVSYTDTNPGASLEPLDIQGKSVNVTLAARHPFMRSRQENLFGNLGFRYRNSESVLGLFNAELYDDHVRNLYAGADYDVIDGWGAVNRIDTEITQGLDILDGNDAGDFLSRANGESGFTKLSVQYTRLQPLTRHVSAFFGVSGQYAFDPLLASEEFGIGGEPYGSAYDPAEITGDHGFAGRLEMRYSDAAPSYAIDAWQIYAFYDGGKVYNRETLPDEKVNQSLTSAGVGTRISLTNNLSATAEIAAPLTHQVVAEGSDGDDLRGFFSLIYGF